MLPHWLAIVPATHVPELQQPPLHGLPAEHVEPQTLLTHAISAGQSVAAWQPQTPVGRQTAPAVPAAQLTHAPPDVPHAAVAAPVTHSVPLQHPPLHGPFPVHETPHECVDVLQASPFGQSLATLHGVPVSAASCASAASAASCKLLASVAASVSS